MFLFPIFDVHPWKASEYVDNLSGLNEFIDKSPMIGKVVQGISKVKEKTPVEIKNAEEKCWPIIFHMPASGP